MTLQGYPACAGIDLYRKSVRPKELRLPRMRGDRPKRPSSFKPTHAATPHARGSTW